MEGGGGRRLSHLLPLHQHLHPRPTDPLMLLGDEVDRTAGASVLHIALAEEGTDPHPLLRPPDSQTPPPTPTPLHLLSVIMTAACLTAVVQFHSRGEGE